MCSADKDAAGRNSGLQGSEPLACSDLAERAAAAPHQLGELEIQRLQVCPHRHLQSSRCQEVIWTGKAKTRAILK